MEIEKENIITLTKRVNKKPLPKIEIIDVTNNNETNKQAYVTDNLLKEITHCINKKQKCMILVNRRGYAPYIYCDACSRIHRCPGCNLSYTYHKNKTFNCHRCQISEPAHNTCQHCQQKRLQFSGVGTQSVMFEIQKFLPEAKIIRIDKDITKNAKECEMALNDFKKNGDILIGTQMIAKGHDIEEVTLVAVLGIESTLNIPDFKCAENTFQLLTQVAGRAGRGNGKEKYTYKQYRLIIMRYKQQKVTTIKNSTTKN